MPADPVLIEIVEGTLASVEKEVETAIARTARSPMIRDAHDFRAGIHDVRLRKLTGRSYSALVQPVVRDFPIAEMNPGDVFFHNDVYLSEGGIGHLPDLCVTVPVFHGGEVVAFVQAFGHHDDIGGAVPGSMPSHATSVFEEGLMVPPIKLWDRGVPNRAALTIMTRNSRMPDSLAGDLDAECSACLMGARRLGELFDRYGREAVEACFDAIIAKTTETFRRELLAKIPEGTYVWEDYAEHDGVDEPRLHAQRITLTVDHSAPEPLIIDFTGTSPQAKGPINHAGDYADGVFLKKWLAPILRNLADTPERMAELDVNEGVVPLMKMIFPEKGTLLTPVFPAPTNARTFVILRLLGVLAGVLAKATGGRMPADQETIRYTGVYGTGEDGAPYLMREVLGGGSGGRWYADGEDTIHVVPDSRNIPVEFAESRWPFRVERLGLAVDSGGPGMYRGGLGYDKHIRMLRDASFMSIADRSILSCWGVNGGRAGRPFLVTIEGREMDGLVDDSPVRAGEVIRIRTTGGGGWGCPYDRDPDLVAADVRDGKVSREGAESDYGVVPGPRRRGGQARHHRPANPPPRRTPRQRPLLRPRPRLPPPGQRPPPPGRGPHLTHRALPCAESDEPGYDARVIPLCRRTPTSPCASRPGCISWPRSHGRGPGHPHPGRRPSRGAARPALPPPAPPALARRERPPPRPPHHGAGRPPAERRGGRRVGPGPEAAGARPPQVHGTPAVGTGRPGCRRGRLRVARPGSR
ncbi:hydantoinase B/oxoprolinase family protein [Thermocatellispora tengchongensis]|uniref:hydantoinase B/oxoprolinase family protein n=1 Tax=Thermocatellispora tengchongensis TaxID=1073253 RepID=UPI003644D682